MWNDKIYYVKQIIVSADVVALQGMPCPSQVTPTPYPHHFSPVLTPTFSLSALTTLLWCGSVPSRLSRNHPVSIIGFVNPDSDPGCPCSSFFLEGIWVLGFGIWSWSGCKTCFQSGQTVWEPGLRAWLASATLSSFNGLTVLMQAGTRSRQDTHVLVYNQINSFRDQYSSAA